MVYIFTATKTEAQALVEHFKLQKKENFFTNEMMQVHISGVGIENAYSYAKNLQPQISLEDSVINIGIAAAPKQYAIGEIVTIKNVCFKDEELIVSKEGEKLLTCKTPQKRYQETIVDMEGFGFAKVFAKYNFKIYKVISDHFEPENITKDGVKKLLKSALLRIDIE